MMTGMMVGMQAGMQAGSGTCAVVGDSWQVGLLWRGGAEATGWADVTPGHRLVVEIAP